MKTSELTGAALDWAVAKCEGVPTTEFMALQKLPASDVFWKYQYSTDWSQGGPIIDREGLTIIREERLNGAVHWVSYRQNIGTGREGLTPLIAAMRCYVASKLGDTVDVPKELT